MWVAGGKLISNPEPNLFFIFSFKLISIEFDLYQNYPNPFNPSTRISYSPPYASFVSINVYDVLGKEIAMLVNEEKTAGTYAVEYDAASFTSGIYFYTLQSGSFVATKKMILLN